MAILQCNFCKKLDVKHNRDGKDKITCIDCDEKQKKRMSVKSASKTNCF